MARTVHRGRALGCPTARHGGARNVPVTPSAAGNRSGVADRLTYEVAGLACAVTADRSAAVVCAALVLIPSVRGRVLVTRGPK